MKFTMKWIQRMLLKEFFYEEKLSTNLDLCAEDLKYAFEGKPCEFGADEWKSNVNRNEQISSSF